MLFSGEEHKRKNKGKKFAETMRLRTNEKKSGQEHQSKTEANSAGKMSTTQKQHQNSCSKRKKFSGSTDIRNNLH